MKGQNSCLDWEVLTVAMLYLTYNIYFPIHFATEEDSDGQEQVRGIILSWVRSSEPFRAITYSLHHSKITGKTRDKSRIQKWALRLQPPDKIPSNAGRSVRYK